MDLVIQFPGNGMVPRERFGPIPQLFMGAATEQHAEQLMTHREVMQNLEHIDQHGDGHREQNQRLERVDHLDSATLIKLE